MRVYGLTGNIGTGKSTVARLLRERGVPVIDADLVAREVVEPGRAAYDDIKTRWPDVIAQDGTLDRPRLAAKVFADEKARLELNAITHPRIAAEVAARLAALREGGAERAIYEAALIVENGFYKGLDGLIVVTAPREKQLERLAKRGQHDAEARIASQLAQEEKVRVATHVIDNAGDETALAAQVDALVAKL